MPTTTINSVFLLMISLIITLPSSSFSLSFNFTTIGRGQARYINATGNATISSQGIHVTPDERSPDYQTGRATYVEPLHLWDMASRNLTSFTTHFSFVIDANGSDYGDGLAFFLAPVGSSIQPWSYGGSLGLGNGNVALYSSYSFVAVEFDTYLNVYDDNDAPIPHVGIDISSMASVNVTAWENDITQGRTNDAWISYNASSMLLRVYFTGSSRNTTSIGTLSRVVDLRDELPEYVNFGFSAATAVNYERHIVKSWEFSSFDLIVAPERIDPAPVLGPAPEPEAGSGPGLEPEAGPVGPGPEPEARPVGPGPETGPRPRPGPGPGMLSSGGNENRTPLIVGLSLGLPLVISIFWSGCSHY